MSQSVHESLAPAPEMGAGARVSQVKSPQTTPESKREEFRHYLEHADVLDTITRVLIALYEEQDKPPNPMEYFLEQLAGRYSPNIPVSGVPAKQELDVLQSEFAELEARATELEQKNDRLREELEHRAAIEILGGGATSEVEDLGEEAEAEGETS